MMQNNFINLNTLFYDIVSIYFYLINKSVGKCKYNIFDFPFYFQISIQFI